MSQVADEGAVDASSAAVPNDPPALPRRPRPVFLVLGLVLAAALAVGLFTSVGTNSSSPGRPRVGSQVPTFSVARLGGGPSVSVPGSGGGNGRPAVLLFFASWCGPCQNEIPAVARAYRQQHRTGQTPAVALIGIDANDPTNNALAFVHHAGVTFPVGADGNQQVTDGLFYFNGLPEAVAVRADGTISAIHYGAISTTQLAKWESSLSPSGR